MSRERPVVGECIYCGKRVAWTQDAYGKNIPMDIKPVPDGEFIVTPDPDRPRKFLATSFNREDLLHAGAWKRWRSHLKTCTRKQERTVEHCQAEGCREFVQADQVVCPKHWGLLPPSLRDQLRTLYRKRPGSPEHRAAVEQALRLLKGRAVAHG